MEEKIKKSNVEGIYYLIKRIGSYRYLYIMHIKTSKVILGFGSAPIKIRDAIKISDRILRKVNWNIMENELTDNHKKAIYELENAIYFDRENGRYIINPEVV